jgi:hypothetical protein
LDETTLSRDIGGSFLSSAPASSRSCRDAGTAAIVREKGSEEALARAFYDLVGSIEENEPRAPGYQVWQNA